MKRKARQDRCTYLHPCAAAGQQEDAKDARLIATKGLFAVHLNRLQEARRAAQEAAALDTTGSETLIKVAQVYAALGDKPSLLDAVRRARWQNNEYDIAYLRTAFDFLNF